MISLKPTLFVSFRAHTGPVLSLTVSPNGDFCFSGGVDNTIRCWNLPSSNIDPYDSFGKSRLAPMQCLLRGYYYWLGWKYPNYNFFD